MPIGPTKNKTPSPSFPVKIIQIKTSMEWYTITYAPEELQIFKLTFANIGKDVIKLDASQIFITNAKLFIYLNIHPSE